MKTAKRVIASLITASMIFAECSIGGQLATAASTPTMAKSLNITAGRTKKIRVKGTNIISKKFKSSNTRIATVSKKGVVKAKKAGKCKIKVTVKYRRTKKAKKISKKVLSTVVKVKKAAVLPTPSIEPSSVPDAEQTMEPSTLPETTPALLPSDSAEPTQSPQILTVTTQKELEDALKMAGVRSLTLKTSSAEKFTIPAGEYKDIDLVVNVPNADIVNAGLFKSVTVQAIKADTWTERARGNVFSIFASVAHIVVARDADVPKIILQKTDMKPKVTITAEGAVLKRMY